MVAVAYPVMVAVAYPVWLHGAYGYSTITPKEPMLKYGIGVYGTIAHDHSSICCHLIYDNSYVFYNILIEYTYFKYIAWRIQLTALNYILIP